MIAAVVLAAATTRQPTWLDIAFIFAGFMIPIGAFFVATGHNARLHRWMLDDRIYNSGKRLPPGYREYMTRLAPKMGWGFIVFGIGFVLLAAVA